jgi:hypothetical protein
VKWDVVLAWADCAGKSAACKRLAGLTCLRARQRAWRCLVSSGRERLSRRARRDCGASLGRRGLLGRWVSKWRQQSRAAAAARRAEAAALKLSASVYLAASFARMIKSHAALCVSRDRRRAGDRLLLRARGRELWSALVCIRSAVMLRCQALAVLACNIKMIYASAGVYCYCLPSTTVCPRLLFALNYCSPSTTVRPQLLFAP